MKSFDKFNVEAMVHHIALKEGMSCDEVLNEVAPLLAAPLVVPAAKAALTGVGAWAAYNAAKKLMPQQRQQTPAVDYGQMTPTVTKAQTSQNQPTGASGPEGSVTARRQAQRAARQQPTPEPPKPPKPRGLIKKAVTAVGGATAGAVSLSGDKRVGPPGTKPAVPTPDPEDSKPKPLSKQSQKAAETIFKLKPGSLEQKPEPAPPAPRPAIPTGQEPKPKPKPKPAQPTNLQGFRSGPFTYTPPASPRPPRSYEIKPRTR